MKDLFRHETVPPFAFFEIVNLPELWTLGDTLMWVGLSILPTCNFDLDGNDLRQTLEGAMEGPSDLGYGDWAYFPDYVFTNRGLPPCPEDNAGSVEAFRKIVETDPSYRPDLDEALLREAQFQDWLSEVDNFLDLAKMEIVISLRKSNLIAYGIPFSGGDNSMDAQSKLEEIQSNEEFHSLFKEIPSSAWVSTRIDWTDSDLSLPDESWCSIRLSRNQILSLFPPDSSDRKLTLSHSQSNYFTPVGDVGPSTALKIAKKRGRPTKQWEAVLERAMCIIIDSGLPAKQDAFAQQLCDWYTTEFGERVGLSTMKSKLSKFYNISKD